MELASTMAQASRDENLVCKVTNWDEFWIALDKYNELATDEKAKLVFVEEERLKVYTWLKKKGEEIEEQLANQEEIGKIAKMVTRFDNELVNYQKFYGEHGSELFVQFFNLYAMDHDSCKADFSRKVYEKIDPKEYEDKEELLNTAIGKLILMFDPN